MKAVRAWPALGSPQDVWGLTEFRVPGSCPGQSCQAAGQSCRAELSCRAAELSACQRPGEEALLEPRGDLPGPWGALLGLRGALLGPWGALLGPRGALLGPQGGLPSQKTTLLPGICL